MVNLLQPNAKPGDVRFVDTNKDGVVDEYDRVNIGNGMPPWTLGLNADMEWKGFDLSTVFHVSLGNDVFDVSRRTDLPPVNLLSYMLKRWTGPAHPTEFLAFQMIYLTTIGVRPIFITMMVRF